MEEKERHLSYKFSIFFLIITPLFCVATLLYLYLSPAEESNKQICDLVNTEIRASDYEWISEQEVIAISTEKNIIKVKISGCELNYETITQLDTSVSDVFFCSGTTNLIAVDDEEGDFYFFSKDNEYKVTKLDSFSFTKLENNPNESLVLHSCVHDTLVLEKSLMHQSKKFYRYDLTNKSIFPVETTDETYTYLPTEAAPMTFQFREKSGLYYGDRLLLDEQQFGYWDINFAENSLYYSIPNENQTSIFKLFYESNPKELFVGDVHFVLSSEFKISPKGKKLLTTDFNEELLILSIESCTIEMNCQD